MAAKWVSIMQYHVFNNHYPHRINAWICMVYLPTCSWFPMVNVAEYTMRRSNRGLISKYSHTESSWGSSLSSSTWGIWVIPRVVAPRCRGASDIFQQRADFCTMIIMLTIDNVTCMYNIAKRIYLYKYTYNIHTFYHMFIWYRPFTILYQ